MDGRTTGGAGQDKLMSQVDILKSWVGAEPLSSSTCSSLREAGLLPPDTCGRGPPVWPAGRAGTCCTPWCTPLFPADTTGEEVKIRRRFF